MVLLLFTYSPCIFLSHVDVRVYLKENNIRLLNFAWAFCRGQNDVREKDVGRGGRGRCKESWGAIIIYAQECGYKHFGWVNASV